MLLSVLLAAALYASVNVIVLLCHLLMSRTYEIAEHSPRDTILFGQESASKFGFIGASLQALMVSFVICTSLIGFYSLPSVYKHIYPRPHSSSMALLLFNATCILNGGFCRPANYPCLQLSLQPALPPDSTHYFDAFQPDVFPFKAFPKSPNDHDQQPLHRERDLPRAKDFWTKRKPPTQQQHQHHLRTMSLSSPPSTRGLMIVLVYNLGFITICWRLFRLHVRDLVKVKEQLASVWVWWLGAASSNATSR
ncbi:hypothetical protein TcWFU_003879 [Taenia crassiceps]|uniref:Uncharacterized protein n=1 Tax=Taenia crassiceps TaxID=6207 RepID=A0ABR4QK18_9CEST